MADTFAVRMMELLRQRDETIARLEDQVRHHANYAIELLARVADLEGQVRELTGARPVKPRQPGNRRNP